MAKCKATTGKGKPCKKDAVDEAGLCNYHNGDTKPGRPTSLTQEVHDEIVRLILVGNYADTAALATGIDEKSYYNWLERGELDVELGRGTVFAQFFQAIKRSAAEAEVTQVNFAMTGPSGKWQAHMTWLERRYPKKWGRQEKRVHELTGKVELTTPANDERRAEVARLLSEDE